MIRCYLPPGRWAGEQAELDEAESKHVAGVMRAQAGARIELLDGAGRVGAAEVVAPHKKRTAIRILSQERKDPFAPRRILAQALVREQKMDWLIQKAVELGVHAIWPLQTDHAVVKIRAEEAERKAARWQAIALAACKQSGNPWLPEIAPPRPLAAALAALRGAPGAACFGALQEGAVPLPEFFGRLRREACPQVAAFIGPEGDFSPAEVAALLAAGVQPVTFGPIVFRVETAALFVLSALQYAWLP
ncbi:MAG TPA: 16S rRNA (uracil(1498)-N(3))-methyltransferase [Kiritimatiellia bacterium]|nr:16S rRNA (uracil(1498)-N(3))-methyltransferase [Kiritimatiellia bacterium]